MNIKWHKRFLEIAKEVSTWSKDPSSKIGAVIVDSNTKQIISQGYNGFPRGIVDSIEILNNRELKYKYVIHAEINAIFNALYNGSSVKGSTIYVHGLPVCSECAKAIIQTGIKHVVYDSKPKEQWKESSDFALKLLSEANIIVTFVEI